MPDSILEHFKDICWGRSLSRFPVFYSALRDIVSFGKHFLRHIQLHSHFFYCELPEKSPLRQSVKNFF